MLLEPAKITDEIDAHIDSILVWYRKFKSKSIYTPRLLSLSPGLHQARQASCYLEIATVVLGLQRECSHSAVYTVI